MSLWLTSFQTTEHGPALARRSLWVSVPGAPQRATFSIALAPLARRGVHVSRSPGSVLGRRTPIRDARLALAARQGHHTACDRPHTLSARRLSNRTKASCGRLAAGPFYA